MNQDDWRTEDQKDMDLRLENQSLETELNLQGGGTFKNREVDPKIENAFLKNVIAYEEADKEPPVPVRSLFPEGYEFPPVSSMSRRNLSKKIKEIAEILSAHNVEFGFANKLPDEVLYKYIAEDFIPHEMIGASIQAGFTFVIDGCDGCCEECFQKSHCPTAREILDEDDLTIGGK